MRPGPALTREPGDLPVAVVFRADRVFRADGGEPERRQWWPCACAGRCRASLDEPHRSRGQRPCRWGHHVRTLFPKFRSEEHTSELQSLMRISYAVFCLKKKKPNIATDRRSLHSSP